MSDGFTWKGGKYGFLTLLYQQLPGIISQPQYVQNERLCVCTASKFGIIKKYIRRDSCSDMYVCAVCTDILHISRTNMIHSFKFIHILYVIKTDILSSVYRQYSQKWIATRCEKIYGIAAEVVIISNLCFIQKYLRKVWNYCLTKQLACWKWFWWCFCHPI
jgi:hypothetical protein